MSQRLSRRSGAAFVLIFVSLLVWFGRSGFLPAPNSTANEPSSTNTQRVESETQAATDENQTPRIAATQVAKLRQLVGQEVTIFGEVGNASVSSRSGTNFLNLANTELSIVCFPDNLKNFTEGAPAKVYKDQSIEVTGTLKLYQGKLQILLSNPSQIKIADEKPAAESTPFILKKVAETTWQSPAGLIYRGRDPEGLTRVEHIMRHAKDIPSRPGPHGVFAGDGDQSSVFRLIDEAWISAKKRGTRAQVEGDRSTLTVSLGRKVGYLGGQTGRGRGHPALSRIFIVFETDTKNVITAFPR